MMRYISDSRHQQALELALQKIRESVIAEYIMDVILYGSCARKKQKYSSDVDILLVLSSRFSNTGEYKMAMRKLQSEVRDTELWSPEIDMHIVIDDHWEDREGQYYRNIREEGLSVWH